MASSVIRLLLLGAALNCTPARESKLPSDESEASVDAGIAMKVLTLTPERSASSRKLRVRLTGVVAPNGSQWVDNPAGADAGLEICPGAAFRPCSGVDILGSIPPELVSTRTQTVVAQLEGSYDGAAIELDTPARLAPVRAQPDYRNPCAEHQSVVSFKGDGNPRPTLHEIATRIEHEEAARFAGAWWDRHRQTFTVRMTGDVSHLASRYTPPSRRDRLCLVGGAKHSMQSLLQAFDNVVVALDASRAWLIEGGPNVWANRIEVRVEHADAALARHVSATARVDVGLESFIEVLEGSIADLPEPEKIGDIPLITSARRWSYGGMHALGHFAIRLDEAARCVYLRDARGQRVLPIWPHGYSAHSNPLRVLDFDARIVSKGGEIQTFGGGHFRLEDMLGRPENTCGAISVWSGTPH